MKRKIDDWKFFECIAMIDSPVGVMAMLIAVVSFWFWLEKKSQWKIFGFLPPLIWIYATPVILSNAGLIPFENAAYDFLRAYGLPIFICLMLIKVDVVGAVRIMGKGVLVMLLGSVGVVVGGFLAYTLGQAITTPEGFGELFQAGGIQFGGVIAGRNFRVVGRPSLFDRIGHVLNFVDFQGPRYRRTACGPLGG
ncbi:MAG: DUF819 family protein [Lysobacterales bacterium]